MNTDDQIKELIRNSDLQNALAKMLPKYVEAWAQGETDVILLAWKRRNPLGRTGNVLETELLHLCSLVEAGLTLTEVDKYRHELNKLYGQGIHPAFATWQQRTPALAAIKGIELPKEETK